MSETSNRREQIEAELDDLDDEVEGIDTKINYLEWELRSISNERRKLEAELSELSDASN